MRSGDASSRASSYALEGGVLGMGVGYCIMLTAVFVGKRIRDVSTEAIVRCRAVLLSTNGMLLKNV